MNRCCEIDQKTTTTTEKCLPENKLIVLALKSGRGGSREQELREGFTLSVLYYLQGEGSQVFLLGIIINKLKRLKI